jgi:kanamycin nucleotidyltransferase
MLAAAVIGSVAHGAAAEHSDVELVVVTDPAVAERDEYFFDEGVMVECALVQAERLLASARSVPWNWGIKADAYRHQIPLFDPKRFFERVRRASESIVDEEFELALEQSWWILFEERGKLRNAIAQEDTPRAVYLGWELAYGAAMRIALRERRPYESVRTLWRDAASRGYGMRELVDALVQGSLPEITRRIDDLWGTIGAWDVPPGAPSP